MNTNFQMKGITQVTLFLGFLVTTSGCTSTPDKNVISDKSKIVELKIESVDFYMTSIHRIDCDYFTFFFKKDVKKTPLRILLKLQGLERLYKHLK